MFFYAWIYLNLLRIIAIVCMKKYAGDIDGNDIFWSIFYGAKMSLKTAGVLMLLSFIFATLYNFCLRKKDNRLRIIVSVIFFFITNFLFIAKFSYYKEFHTSFNEMVFNAVNDDISALFYTMIEQYNLLEGTVFVAIITFICTWILKQILCKNIFKSISFSKYNGKWYFRLAIIVMTLSFALFVRFGGSFSYAKSIHWENYTKTKDTFLNEMILDDMQAIYRGYSIKKRIDNGIIYGVDKTQIKSYVEKMANYTDSQKLHQENARQIDDNLYYEAQGTTINKKQHIFIIIGESFAQWPTLENYADLHLADNMRELMQQENTTYTHNFMPNGAFTPMAVNAVICGLSDVNIYPNHQYESYRQVYKTSLAPQLKKLGYKTQFWYSGFSGWERIKDFALAQGFDEFHCASDYQYPSGNVWGSDDKFIFDKLQEEIAENAEPTVYVILSVSNHAPYSVDLAKEGFPKEELRAKLPQEVQGNEDLLNRLGHYWYTDKVIGKFIKNVEKIFPQQNLFVITGDHADRTNIEDKPTMFNRYSVPFIVYGEGIKKAMISPNMAGGHINLGATIIELIAPKGFGYYSLGKSLTRKSDFSVGFNDNTWLTSEDMGKIDGNEPEKVAEMIKISRTISWWRTMKGNDIE